MRLVNGIFDFTAIRTIFYKETAKKNNIFPTFFAL